VGEHARVLDAAPLAHPARCAIHVRLLGRVAGEAQREIGLDRRGEIAGRAAVVAPGAVGALLAADPARRGDGLGLGADAEELTHE
jgi:hypothetical protein